MSASTEIRALHRLARLHGVHPVWRDAEQQVRTVEPDALLGVLGQLGVDVAPATAASAARAARAEREARIVAPFVALWDDALAIDVRPGVGVGRLQVVLRAYDLDRGEPGAELGAWSVRVEGLAEVTTRSATERVFRFEVPLALELGWYELRVTGPVPPASTPRGAKTAARSDRALVVRAPRLLAALPRGVGLFAPVHELHDARTRHAGGWREFGRLADWAGEQGLDRVATLPMTACDPDEASPYSPLSRRFWNERYLDPLGLPELYRSPAARQHVASAPQRDHGALVDPASATRLVHAVLGPCSRALEGARAGAFAAFLRKRPDVERYAAWRAARDAPSANADPAQHVDALGHAYAQWACEEALEALARQAERSGVELLLDLPLGVRRDGFDVFDAPAAYLVGASTGAPPDALFRGGQDWSFPPPHPEHSRRQGHRELALAVRRHARFAGALRLDHVMSLHRLWVIPPGGDARSGAYVRFAAEEQLAVIGVEAARASCAIVGEDLGTVPDSVRDLMREHGLHRTLVLPFTFDAHDPAALGRVTERAVISVGTHDTAPFAAFWTGRDLDEHAERAELPPAEIEAERHARARFRDAWRSELQRLGLLEPAPAQDDPLASEVAPVLAATLAALADTPARHLSVGLDDLLLEPRRQNAPGTLRPENWRIPARLSLEELAAADGPARLLRELVERRSVPVSPHPLPTAHP